MAFDMVPDNSAGAPHSDDPFNKAGGVDAYLSIIEAQKTYTAMLAFLGRVVEEKGYEGVNGAQAVLLWRIHQHQIAEKPALSLSDIKRLGYYIGTNVTYNMDALDKGGYIERVNVGEDRRTKRVYLTDNGQAVGGIVQQALDAFNSVMSTELGRQGVNAESVFGDMKRVSKVADDLATGAYIFPSMG